MTRGGGNRDREKLESRIKNLEFELIDVFLDSRIRENDRPCGILPKARQSRHVLVFQFSICYLLLFPHPREILRSAQNDGPERLSSQIAIGDTAGEQTATVEQIAIVFGSPIAVRKDGGYWTFIKWLHG